MGFRVTVGRRGVTRTIGLPGTGPFYRSRSGFHTGYHSAVSDTPRTPEQHATAAQRFEIIVALVFVAIRRDHHPVRTPALSGAHRFDHSEGAALNWCKTLKPVYTSVKPADFPVVINRISTESVNASHV